MGEILTVRNLKVNFSTMNGEVKAVRDVSFQLHEGEVLAVVGESGCGKTVMVKSLLRLHDKTNAVISDDTEILYNGENIRTLDKKGLKKLRGKEISMIFQDSMTSLNPTTPVGKQIEETLKIHTDLSAAERKKRVLELMRLVEISDPQNRVKEYPHQLSGGMRQRIMIAMALACEPRVLLADEPTTALDVTIQSQLLDLLDHLKKKMGMSIILVTHDLNVVLGFAERVQVMYAGQIIERGTTEEIAKFSRHPYTWALLQAVPSEYVKPKSKLYSITGTPPDLRLPLEHCPFAARCQYCMKVCKEHMPPEVQLTETQSVRCWLADERAPKVVSPVGGEIR